MPEPDGFDEGLGLAVTGPDWVQVAGLIALALIVVGGLVWWLGWRFWDEGER